MRFVFAFMALLAASAVSHSQIRSTCALYPSGLVDSIESGGGDFGASVKTECFFVTVGEALKGEPDTFREELARWQQHKETPFTDDSRLTRYRLTVRNFSSTPGEVVLHNDLGFMESPYYRALRVFSIPLQPCHERVISFISPWPPRIQYVRVNKADDSGWAGSWGITFSEEIRIAVPDTKNANPAAVNSQFFVEQNEDRRITIDGSDILRCH